MRSCNLTWSFDHTTASMHHSLYWLHNGRHGVWNQWQLDRLFNSWSMPISKETTKPASLALCKGNHRWPVDYPHKGPVTWKTFPCHGAIMHSPHHYTDAIMSAMASGVSNHQPHDCLLNCLLRLRSKETSRLRVTGLCVGNSPVTSEFPAQMASNAEHVSIWWRHHVIEHVHSRYKYRILCWDQIITPTNVDLSSKVFYDIRLRVISQ